MRAGHLHRLAPERYELSVEAFGEGVAVEIGWLPSPALTGRLH